MATTLQTNESVVINRPVPEVFGYLSDPDHALEWATNITECTTVSGPPDEVGSTMSVTARVAGARVHATEEITAFERNKGLALESRESRIGYTREMDFESDGDGATKVTIVQDAETGSGLFKFADVVAQKLYARDIRTNLENAKTILEST